MQNISTIKKQVEYCLKNYPTTRNSDNMLMKVWAKEFHGISLDGIESLGSLTSIDRARRFFQSQGLYMADDEVLTARAENREEYRKNYSPNIVSGL